MSIAVFDTAKRFYRPIFREPGYFWRIVAVNFFFAGYSVASVMFIRAIVGIVEKQNLEALPECIAWYVGFNVAFFFATYVIRHWGWAESIYHLLKMIQKEYMKKFDALDNTYVENIGTGKIISIVGKGSDVWAGLIIDSISSLVRLTVSIS